jgi:hypothetical protein
VPAGGNTEKGDVFIDKVGRRLLVVDKPQRKQTIAYWVQATSYDGLKEMVARRYWQPPAIGDGYNIGWVTNPATPTASSESFRRPWTAGRLSICAEDELDEESNEFGVICP